MSEIITTYSLDTPTLEEPMNRERFYDEQIQTFKDTGKPTRAVAIFNAFLFTEKKELILQKRSHTKRHNPRMIDKTIGGHIQFGDSLYYTAMVECVQELQIPAVVLRKEESFSRTYYILKHSLENTAVLDLIDQDIFHLTKMMDGEPITIANHSSIFFGIYSGASKPVDREASGILYYNLDVLQEEMDAMPALFTDDMHVYMKKYRKQMDEFLTVLDEKQ